MKAEKDDSGWSGGVVPPGMLWMVAKSCTTLDGFNKPTNNGISKIYQLAQDFAGPSTVCSMT